MAATMTAESGGREPARPLRVLHVVDGLDHGGAQSLVYAFAKLAAGSPLSVYVSAIAPTHDPALAARIREVAAGFELVETGAIWDLRLLRALVRAIRRYDVDLVHTHLPGADVVGGVAAKLTRKPLVSTLHAVADHRSSWTVQRRVLSNLATRHLPDALIAVGEATRDSHVRLLDLPPQSIEVILNTPVAPLLLPDDFDRESKRRELGLDGFGICMVARLDPQKDHETLVRGMHAVLDVHPETTALLVGDGPRRPQLEGVVAVEGLSGRVRLLGQRADAVEVMAACDVACQLTVGPEGIPVALLDALALGLPTVATAARGADEVIEHLRSGLLVPKDDAGAFASAVGELLADPGLRARLGEEGRRRVDAHFGAERWMTAIEAVYRRVLDGRSRPSSAATSPEQQIAAEARLARRLRDAPERERRALYGEVYDEVYGMSLPARGETAVEQTFGASPRLLGLLERISVPGDDVLEVGCGTGYLSLELARRGRDVTGIDVSAVAVDIARRHAAGTPARFEVASAVELPFPDSSFDVVFSVEVMEHLHPSDARAHLSEAARVLRRGGRYWVLTPNRVVAYSAAERFGVEGTSAGGDIHLKEWTYAELAAELRSAGLGDLRSPWRSGRLHRLPLLPLAAKRAAERVVGGIPFVRARRLAATALGVANCSIVARRR
jgi:glycosyltransferase involved in cell wall biosynthesis/2-polyprenyl-3-methyl-5-hydroxy-6-metoxy-1,4-benzoquinol methylase